MTSAPVEAIEVRGRTIETAIEQGLEELGLIRSQVAIEVVYPGSRGVLGIGAEDAVVRLTPRLPAAVPEARCSSSKRSGRVSPSASQVLSFGSMPPWARAISPSPSASLSAGNCPSQASR